MSFNFGKFLGAMSPGIAATGLLGHGAQGVGQGMLSMGSPLLALLLSHKHNGSAPVQTPAATPAPVAAPAQTGSPLDGAQPAAQLNSPSLQQTMAGLPQMDPNAAAQAAAAAQRRKNMGLSLMQLGPRLAGGYGSPFGSSY